MRINGSEIIIECLKEQGVDTVFGYPGGSILNVYDALYKHRDEIHHILTSHEQGASHAADGYARATGKVGVCFATSGPGATNLVTGIATAYMDSVPMVAITCNVVKPLLGKDSFQEIDIAGITMPVTKHNYIVKDVNTLADTIRRAFAIARTGRPGPVLVDVTKDVTATETEYIPQKPTMAKRYTSRITDESIEDVISSLEQSRRPFILIGGGVRRAEATEELNTLVELLQAPVADTLMGKGAFDGHKAAYTGMVGMHGTKASNYGITESDLLLAIGVRFSDRVLGNIKTFARHAEIIHIDVDEAEVNKNLPCNISIIGDAKAVLERLNEKLKQQHHEEWMQQIMDLKDKYPLTYDKTVLTGPAVVDSVYRISKGEALICTEVGQNQMWAAQFFKYKYPRQLMTSGGLGTMGYGLGASIGAKLGCPEKIVFNIAGDGCFRMNMNELATAARYQVPVIEVVLNNSVLGMVRQWQTLFYGERYSGTVLDHCIDYVKLAESMGIAGFRVTELSELDAAIEKAMGLNKPVLIECVIDADEKVWPMVAPGASIADAFSEEDMQIQNQ